MTINSPTLLAPSATLLDTLSCAILVLDAQRSIRYANETALTIFSQSASNLLQTPIQQLFSEDLLAKLNANTDQLAFVLRDQLVFIAPTSNILADVSINNLPPGCFAEQTSDWLIIEVHPLDRLTTISRNTQLQHQHDAIKQLARNLAHEIKNPLGGILGAAQLLDSQSSPQQAELVEIIQQEVSRLRRLVDNMLGPNQPLAKQSLNIHQLLSEVILLLNKEQPDLVFTVDYDPSIPEISVDKDRIYGLFLNLISNARDAIKSASPTTETEIKTTTKKKAIFIQTRIERQFTIASIRHKMVLRVAISDNGYGISEDIRHKIFLPTITTKPTGTGLGLAIAQTIANQHQGIIVLEPETETKGLTTFQVYLPYIDSFVPQN
jgi:two-component system nitrogen regulation sensor histidine kinase GlnL